MIKLLTGQDLLGAWVRKTPPQLSIMPAIKECKKKLKKNSQFPGKSTDHWKSGVESKS
jgi:hypothetical protein